MRSESTSVRQIHLLDDLSGWKVEVWHEVESWIPYNLPTAGLPHESDKTSARFIEESVAKEYLHELCAKNPKRDYSLNKRYVLSCDGGKTGFLINGVELSQPRKTARLTRFSR